MATNFEEFTRCRVCLKSQNNSREKFVSAFDDNDKVAIQIFTFFQHSLNFDKDIHPALVCRSCVLTLNLVENMKATVHRLDEIYFKRLRRDFRINESKRQNDPVERKQTIKIDLTESDNEDVKVPIGSELSLVGLETENMKVDQTVCGVDIVVNHAVPKTSARSQQKPVTEAAARISNKHSKLWICIVCGKKFKYKSFHKTHMAVHSDLKPFSCDVCGKSSKNKYNHKIHMAIHSDLKPFSCDVCGKSFKRKGDLNSGHMLTHSDLRSFKCRTCQQVFKRISNLRNHMKTHSPN